MSKDDMKQVFALELMESCRDGIPYIVKEETGSSWLALAFVAVSLCSCCAGAALENVRARICKRRQTARSNLTEDVDDSNDDPVDEGTATQVPRGRSMRPASGSDGRGVAPHAADKYIADKFAGAETMAHNFKKDELQALARERGVAVNGTKLEIAMRLQGLSATTATTSLRCH